MFIWFFKNSQRLSNYHLQHHRYYCGLHHHFNGSYMNHHPVAILGGGLSGLSCAYYLKQKGIPFTLYEKSKFGGKVSSICHQQSFLEQGPFAIHYQTQTPHILKIIESLKLKKKMIIAPKNKCKQLFYKGKLINLPQSIWQIPFFQIQPPIFSFLKKDLFLTPSHKEDCSVDTWINRHNLQALTPLFDAFFKGIWASSIKTTSAKITLPQLFEISSQKGSLIRNYPFIKKNKTNPIHPLHHQLKGRHSFSFQGGLQTLINALTHNLSTTEKKLETVEKIEWSPNKCCLHTSKTIHPHSHIISTLPSHNLIPLLKKEPDNQKNKNIIRELEKIKYQSIYLHNFIYSQKEQFPQSFGYLVPSSEPSNINGVIFAHESFPTNYKQKSLTLFTQSKDTKTILKELQQQLKSPSQPQETFLTNLPKAIPLFHVHYDKIQKNIQKETTNSHLTISGSFISKPSINSILNYNDNLISRLQQQLSIF